VTRDLLLLFLKKELRDLRSNKQVWPAYFLLPLLAVAMPIVVLALLPLIADPGRAPQDPAVTMLLETVANDSSLAGATITERLARLLLRDLVVFYLLMPVVLAASAAALALVREKEQRTLEPILATPLRDRDLLLAKLFASAGPAMLVAWGTAVVGMLAGMVGGWWRLGVLVLPTAGNIVALLLLSPALTVLAALAGLRASARFTDVPGAMQFTGLVVVPLALVVVAVLGRPAMAYPLVGLVGALLVGLAAVALFASNLKRFRREEILTKWR
jgi:ABC-2 type transport system permease protein